MLAALRFNWTIDVTGMATVLLAAATTVLALSTRKAARATQKDVDLARQQVEAQRRPLLLPTSEIGMQRFAARNAGSGAALNVRVDVRIGDQRELQCVMAHATPVEVGGEIPTPTELGLYQFAELVVWTYEDPAAKTYQTEAHLIDDPLTSHRRWGRVTAITV